MIKMTKKELQEEINNSLKNALPFKRCASDTLIKMCERINKYSTITGYYVEFTYIPKRKNTLTIIINGEIELNNEPMTNTKIYSLIDVIYKYVVLIDLEGLEIIDGHKVIKEESEINEYGFTFIKDDIIILIGENVNDIRKQLHELENKGIYFGMLKWKKNHNGCLIYSYSCYNEYMNKKEYNDAIIDSFIELGNILTSGKIKGFISKNSYTSIHIETSNKGYLVSIKALGNSKKEINYFISNKLELTKKPKKLDITTSHHMFNSEYPILYNDLYNKVKLL